MRSHLFLTIGLYVLSTSGCFFHGGYYPNSGYYQQPGYVPQQPMNGYNVPPGTPIYSPGVPSFPSGGDPNAGGSGGPTPIYAPTNPGNSNSTPPTFAPSNSGGNDPGFDPSTPQGTKSVPLPSDDPPAGGGTTQRPSLTPTSSAKTYQGAGTLADQSTRQLPPQGTDEGDTLVESDEPYVSPKVRPVRTTGDDDSDVTNALGSSGMSGTKTRLSKVFDHDPDFQWVQGKLEFDPDSKTWGIIYDTTPPNTDGNGGYLVLANDPRLKGLNSGDVVWISGTLDNTRDEAVYRLTRITRLQSAQ